MKQENETNEVNNHAIKFSRNQLQQLYIFLFQTCETYSQKLDSQCLQISSPKIINCQILSEKM